MSPDLKASGMVPFDPTSSKQRLSAQDSRSEVRISAMEPVQLFSVDQPSSTEPTSVDLMSVGKRPLSFWSCTSPCC
jgi:hypothetical protein